MPVFYQFSLHYLCGVTWIYSGLMAAVSARDAVMFLDTETVTECILLVHIARTRFAAIEARYCDWRKFDVAAGNRCRFMRVPSRANV